MFDILIMMCQDFCSYLTHLSIVNLCMDNKTKHISHLKCMCTHKYLKLHVNLPKEVNIDQCDLSIKVITICVSVLRRETLQGKFHHIFFVLNKTLFVILASEVLIMLKPQLWNSYNS